MLKASRFFSIIFCFCLVLPVFAQKSPNCKPVTDAMQRVITTDHSISSKLGNRSYEGVTVGGKSYVHIQGKWKVSPMTPQDLLKQEQENIQNAKVYTCKALPDETIGGIAANVYRVHSETPDVGKADATIWISKSSGLPLKSDEDFNDGTNTQHHLIQYSYTNIHPPVLN